MDSSEQYMSIRKFRGSMPSTHPLSSSSSIVSAFQALLTPLCVVQKEGEGLSPQEGRSSEEEEEERTRAAIRKAVRAKNGIKVLVSLLRYRRCIHAADEVGSGAEGEEWRRERMAALFRFGRAGLHP